MPTRNYRRTGLALATAVTVIGLTACGGGNTAAPGGTSYSPNSNEVSVLIGSSGAAETKAVQDAVAAWSKSSGVPTKVIVASNLTQEAAQGFASGKPADVLYVSTDSFAGWAKNGSLEAYGDSLPNKDDFYPGLLSAFTFKDKVYCAPKDFSTLGLVINAKMWADAGLTDADVPKTWADLESVAKKLTKGNVVGLAFGPEVQRIGVFLGQAGGGLVSSDGKTATANSAANIEGLTFVKKALTDGWAKYSSDLGSGWGGEAFGKQQAAMVIEGNWISGAMSSTYPTVKYTVAELPAGKQKSTLQYTNCWGISTDGDNKGAAIELVKALTATDQQLAFAKAFGVMPSIKSAADGYKNAYPGMAAFLAGVDYAQNLPAQVGASDVLKDFNSQLEQLKSKDPKTILDSVQKNLEPVVTG